MVSLRVFAILLILRLGFIPFYSASTTQSLDEKVCSAEKKAETAKEIYDIVMCLKKDLFDKTNLRSDVNSCCQKIVKESSFNATYLFEDVVDCIEEEYNETINGCKLYEWDTQGLFDCNFDESFEEKAKKIDTSCINTLLKNPSDELPKCDDWSDKVRNCFSGICSDVRKIFGDQKLSEEYRMKDVIEPVCDFISSE